MKKRKREVLSILVGIVGENVGRRKERTDPHCSIGDRLSRRCAFYLYLAGGYNRGKRTRGEAVEDCRRNLRYNENCLKVCTRGV